MKNTLMDTADQFIANTYARQPVLFVKGSGATLWDSDGKAYLDFLSGIAVCNLGHSHPAVAKALRDQAETLLHVSNLYYTAPQAELARWLVDHSFADRVFFCNSGAEANEAAIKLTRRYFQAKGEKHRYRIIAMSQSFHGRTMGTLSATGQEKVQKGFDPILQGFDFVPFNDAAAVKEKIGSETCAVMLEPIQGEGGVRVPDPGYLKAIREICDAAGILMILDEVQTGMGRTGRLFAHEHEGVTPDIMSLAKALGNGLPIGAMLAREAVAEAFVPGSHGTTFGGTPIIAAGALAAVRALEAEGLVEQCARVGDYFRKRLEGLVERRKPAEAVFGRGLLIGLKLDRDGMPLVRACLERGFVINSVQSDVLRFAPPLVIQEAEIDRLIDCLDQLLAEAQ